MHSSTIIKVHEPADGILAVTVRCCGDPKTDSVHTIHQLSRSKEVIKQEIAAHQAKVEQLHADKASAIELMKELGVSVGDCGCQ